MVGLGFGITASPHIFKRVQYLRLYRTETYSFEIAVAGLELYKGNNQTIYFFSNILFMMSPHSYRRCCISPNILLVDELGQSERW
jgi:hypothetical protein